MSKIHLERIPPLLSGTLPKCGTNSLIRDILVLQGKLVRLSEQDFYFQKGRESHQRRLDKMKEEYAQIVETANGNDVDFFLEGIREVELKMQEICSPESRHSMFAKAFVEAASNSKISHLQDLLHAKSLFGKLKSLDELMKDEASLLKIFEL